MSQACPFLSLRNKLIILFITFILMAFTMNKSGTGGHWHLVVGYVFYTFLVIHLIWSWRWFKNLFKGRYTVFRTVHLLAIIGMLVPILVILFTLSFSKSIGAATVALWPIKVGNAFHLHCIMAYYFMVFTAIHLGLHGQLVKGMASRVPVLGLKGCRWLTRIFTVIGLYFMVKVQIWNMVFHFTSFARKIPMHKDLWVPTLIFFLIATAIAYITHLIVRLCRK